MTFHVHKPIYATLVALFLFSAPYLAPQVYFDVRNVADGWEHTLASLILVMIMLPGLAVGLGAGESIRRIEPPAGHVRFIRRACIMAFMISMFGTCAIIYVAYMAVGESVLQAAGAIRRLGGFGIISQFCLLFIGPFIWASIRLGKPYRRWLVLLGVLIFIRAALNTERLAVLEFVIPIIVTLCFLGRIRIRLRHAFLLIVGFIGFFIAAELTRSFYVRYFLEKPDDVTVFFALTWTFERLTAYYADPTNKFYYVLFNEKFLETSNYADTFQRIFNRLFDIGLPESSVFTPFIGSDYHHEGLTNPGGFTVLLTDFGPLMPLYLFLQMALFGLAYRAFKNCGLFGLGLYPTFYVAILELPRIHYLFSIRFTFAFLYFCIFYIVYKSMTRRTRNRKAC